MKMYEFYDYDEDIRVVDNATYKMFLQNKKKKINCTLCKDDGRILMEYANGYVYMYTRNHNIKRGGSRMRLKENAQNVIAALMFIVVIGMWIIAERADSFIWLIPLLVLAGIEIGLTYILAKYGR